jgi:hypothetical protein
MKAALTGCCYVVVAGVGLEEGNGRDAVVLLLLLGCRGVPWPAFDFDFDCST